MIKNQISFFIKDTYTGSATDPLSLNLYTYCANNPLIYWDPTGHSYLGKEDYEAMMWYLAEKGSGKSSYQLREPNKADEATMVVLAIGDKLVESFGEIGISFWEGIQERAKKQYDSPYDFVNHITWGISGSTWEGLQERGKKQFDSPYDFVNHATWGALDTVKGTFAPEEPNSPEHILNSFGLAGMVYGGLRFKTNGNGTGISSNSSGFGANVKVEMKTISFANINPNGTASLININVPAISISVTQAVSGYGALASPILFAAAINGGSGNGINQPNNNAGVGNGNKINPKLAELHTKLDELADEHLLPQFREIDPNLKAGYTGSFKTGTVGNPNKPTFGQPIDLNKYDIDYWIESDVLYEMYGNSLKANPKFREILANTLGFEGLKPNKAGFTIKFKPSSK